MRGGKR